MRVTGVLANIRSPFICISQGTHRLFHRFNIVPPIRDKSLTCFPVVIYGWGPKSYQYIPSSDEIIRCLVIRLEGWCLLGVSTMKPAIQEILQYVIDHPEMATKLAIESFFDQFLFSLEKQEWDSLTDQEKLQFADQIDLQIGRPPKGPGRRDNKPTNK